MDRHASLVPKLQFGNTIVSETPFRPPPAHRHRGSPPAACLSRLSFRPPPAHRHRGSPRACRGVYSRDRAPSRDQTRPKPPRHDHALNVELIAADLHDSFSRSSPVSKAIHNQAGQSGQEGGQGDDLLRTPVLLWLWPSSFGLNRCWLGSLHWSHRRIGRDEHVAAEAVLLGAENQRYIGY
jgi:hypothetical protein